MTRRPDGETIEWTVTPDEIGERDYLFIKDNRDEFIEYLQSNRYTYRQSKAGVVSAEFSMERIEISFDRDYIAGIAGGSILPPGEHTRLVREIANRIVAEGTKNTTEGNWVHFFDEFGGKRRIRPRKCRGDRGGAGKASGSIGCGTYAGRFRYDFYLDYCPNYIPIDIRIGFDDEFDTDSASDDAVKAGDRFLYEKREWTIKGFDGLYPNQAVIVCTEHSGNVGYDITRNIDIAELLANGKRIKSEIPENTDLNSVLDQTDLGGAKTRFKNNVAAIRLAKFLHERNAAATDAERKTLAKYVGWGGLPQAFDETNRQWQKEYAELKSLLTSEEYEAAKGSVLNAHYTSGEVIDGIYAALERLGVKGNNRILEPAMGTGNFFGYMPKEIADGAKLYGVELDTVTGRIASKLYPQANVQVKGFEETNFPERLFRYCSEQCAVRRVRGVRQRVFAA